MGEYITKLSRETAERARRQAGIDTGALRASIDYRVYLRGHIVGRIGSDNKIAFLHHEGTKPHLIKPKNKAVKFSGSGGKVIYRKIIRHPGTAPNRYLTDSLRSVVG